jgi:hypothetical protein
VQPIKTALSAEAFLAANPPTDLDMAMWPRLVPSEAPYRCGIHLHVFLDDLKARCAKRDAPEKGCLCLTLNLRTLPTLSAQPVTQPAITFVSRLMDADQTPPSCTIR